MSQPKPMPRHSYLPHMSMASLAVFLGTVIEALNYASTHAGAWEAWAATAIPGVIALLTTFQHLIQTKSISLADAQSILNELTNLKQLIGQMPTK